MEHEKLQGPRFYKKMRSDTGTAQAVLGLSLLLLLIAVSILPQRAQAAPGEEQDRTFLPLLKSGSEDDVTDCNVPGSRYSSLPVSGEPAEMPATEHPDLNLTVRGWQPSNSKLSLVDYGPVDDAMAPQLDTLFRDRRLPRFTDGWDVNGWDWECMCEIEADRPWRLTLLGMQTTPNEVMYTPDSDYDIGGGYDALVLYASPTQLTLKYTREDNVVVGYAIHLEQICVEPDLLALYEQAKANGRGSLPALRGGQALGRSSDGEILVAIRDSGAFMDPRSRDDWWQNQR